MRSSSSVELSVHSSFMDFAQASISDAGFSALSITNAAPSSHSGGTGSSGTITPFRKTAFSMVTLLCWHYTHFWTLASVVSSTRAISAVLKLHNVRSAMAKRDSAGTAGGKDEG